MATTPKGAEATRLHWRGQQQLERQARERMRRLWPLLSEQGQDAWLREAVAAVTALRVLSGNLGASYFRAYVLAETDRTVSFTAERPAQQTIEAISTSLVERGPDLLPDLMRGWDEAVANAKAQEASTKAAVRHVLNGGREAIVEASQQEPRVKGWRRIPNGDSCPFCLMLIDRGAVYTNTSVRFAAHDGCNCMCEPSILTGPPVSVIAFTASKRDRTDADRQAVRDWLRENGDRLRAEHLEAS